MKFLPPQYDNVDIMPIKFLYHYGTRNTPDDTLDIVFKVLDSGKKYVHTIVNPKIEVYIVKPEMRNYTHFKDYERIENLNKYTVSYKNKIAELSKLMKIDYKDVKFCNFIYGSDMKIETYYMMYFLEEYGNNLPKTLSCGFFDIESDTIGFKGFPPLGDPPINAITYIDDISENCYTVILRNPNNPQIQSLEDHIETFIAHHHNKYIEDFPDMKFHVDFFDTEIEMLYSLWNVIRAIDNDILMAWNIPYDIGSIIQRIINLGYMPESVICDPNFPIPTCEFREDKNPLAHKRRHIMDLSINQILFDQMVLHAGIRSAGAKLPSVGLSAISKSELKDNKLFYSDIADIKTFPYVNFRLFIEYNIHDVILLLKLHRKNKDVYDLYTRCYSDALAPTEIFASTSMLTNSITKFCKRKDQGFIVGNNRQRIFKDVPNVFMKRYTVNDESIPDEDDINEELFSVDYVGDDESDDDTDDKKKKKFQGAIVSNANRMLPTGVIINGVPSPKVHDDLIDMDIRAEYPTATCITNQSNETLVAKVFITDLEDLNVPMYSYKFIDPEEEVGYKMNPSVLFTEMLAEGHYINAGEIFMNLPTVDEIFEELEKDLEYYLK